jgi:Flp pilus assembly protein TadD
MNIKFRILIAALLTYHAYSAPHVALAQRADAEVLISQGVLRYEEKQYSESMTLLREALRLDPLNVRGLYYLGLNHMAQQDPESAIQPLESALAIRPNDRDIRYQLGVAYFSLRQYDKAAPLLEQAYKEEPNRENLGYYVGVTRYRRKAYSEAVTALNNVRTKDPNIQQLALFYRGLASGGLGLREEAARDLLEAQRLQAVSPLTESAARLRDALMRVRTLDERFRGQVSLGGFYDDNIAVNPNLRNDPDAAAARRDRQGAPGFLVSVLGDYSFYRNGPLEATATYSFLQTLNFLGLSEFNITSNLGGLSGFYRGTVAELPYQLSATYNAEYTFLGSGVDSFLFRFGPTFTATLIEPVIELPRLGKIGNLTTGLVRINWNNFKGEGDETDGFPEQERDAFNTTGGFLHTVRILDDRLHLRLGYEYDKENARGRDFTYKGNRLRAGTQLVLPTGDLVLRYDFDSHWRDYLNRNSRYPSTAQNTIRRDDTQYTHLVQLDQPLTSRLSLTWQYQGIINKSNLAIYDYKKNVGSLALNYTF